MLKSYFIPGKYSSKFHLPPFPDMWLLNLSAWFLLMPSRILMPVSPHSLSDSSCAILQ